MSNPIRGLVHVTGEHDTGKTTFSLACGVPADRILFVDDDIKGRATVEQIGVANFGKYIDLVGACQEMRELQMHEYCLGVINNIKPGQYDAIVWDTWTRFEKTFHPWVVKNPSQFKEFYSSRGDIKGAEQWGVSFNYEATILDRLLGKAPLVIITTHLKDHRVAVSETKSVKTGKEVPDANRVIEAKCNLRLWLRHNPNSPEPIGLVLKRIAKWEIVEGKLRPVNVLPRKIVPCTWEHIWEYWASPVGNKIVPEEMPDEWEMAILDGTLTADQKMVLRAGLKEIDNEEAFEPEVPEDWGTLLQWADGKLNLKAAEVCQKLGVKSITEIEDVPGAWGKLNDLS